MANCKQMRVLPTLEEEIEARFSCSLTRVGYSCKPENTLSKFVSRALIHLHAPLHKTRVGQSDRYRCTCTWLCRYPLHHVRVNCRGLQGCLAAMKTCAPLIRVEAYRLKCFRLIIRLQYDSFTTFIVHSANLDVGVFGWPLQKWWVTYNVSGISNLVGDRSPMTPTVVQPLMAAYISSSFSHIKTCLFSRG